MKYKDKVVILETNIDDSTPEELSYTMEKLLTAGALDVSFTPIFMKKCRPGNKLTVISSLEKEEELTKIIFKHTSSTGLRRYESERTIMDRKDTYIKTAYGKVKGKHFEYKGIEKEIPEYEDAKKLAEEKNVSIQKILRHF